MSLLGPKALLAVAAALTALAAAGDDLMGAPSWPTEEFHFTRMYYNGFGGGWRGSSFDTDYPEAEYHFTLGVSRLTRVEIGDQARILEVTDDSIFDYPWLYAVEVGRWYLDDVEAARLREYLLRGGFLMTDDFHGSRQWADLRRVDAARVPGSADRRDTRRRRGQARAVRPRRATSRSPASRRCATASPTSRTASRRIGAASTTTRAGSWSRSTSTWTWATPGSTRTTRSTPSP